MEGDSKEVSKGTWECVGSWSVSATNGDSRGVSGDNSDSWKRAEVLNIQQACEPCYQCPGWLEYRLWVKVYWQIGQELHWKSLFHADELGFYSEVERNHWWFFFFIDDFWGRDIPWTEEPGRLWSIGSQRVGHAWSDLACIQNESNLLFLMSTKEQQCGWWARRGWERNLEAHEEAGRRDLTKRAMREAR